MRDELALGHRVAVRGAEYDFDIFVGLFEQVAGECEYFQQLRVPERARYLSVPRDRAAYLNLFSKSFSLNSKNVQ